jgi:uncharacterized ion transporter superfamily protein YfcC
MVEPGKELARPEIGIDWGRVMEASKEIVESVLKKQVETHKIDVESKERLDMKSLADKHTVEKIILTIVITVLIIGGIGGIIMFSSGKIDFGMQITISTITGVFAFLGGRALGK